MDRTKAAARHANQISTVPPFGMQEPHRSWSVERLLPEQLFAPAWESASVWTGERRWLCAVLQAAVHIFLTYHEARTARGQRLFRETQEWFGSKDCDWLYAFESICLHLQLDPDYIRRGLSGGSVPSYRSPARLVQCKAGKLGRPIISLSRAPREQGGHHENSARRQKSGTAGTHEMTT